MVIQSRNAWDDSVYSDERWVSIVFRGASSGSNLKNISDADEWAKTEFGDGFFRLGYKFFFDDPGKLMLFQLRWG